MANFLGFCAEEQGCIYQIGFPYSSNYHYCVVMDDLHTFCSESFPLNGIDTT